jgi:hypothetical protein
MRVTTGLALLLFMTNSLAPAVLLGETICRPVLGQAPPVVLTIDIANYVEYAGDTSDISKYAKNPDITQSAGSGEFGMVTIVGDIIAVKGQPTKGLFAGQTRVLRTTTTPTPARAIADLARIAIREQIFEILQADGRPIGTIVAVGFSGGPPPPGAPSAQRGGNWAIVGGTGAFLGARGEMGGTAKRSGGRLASITEDPANRRINGGGTFQFVLHVIPMSRPEIVTVGSGPAVFHADSSPVTAAKPARPREVLCAKATGLGSTGPGVDPGEPFPLNPVQAINSRVDVMVNHQSAEVIQAAGWPGLVDTYRLDFRIPEEIARGSAVIELTSAWITGHPVKIPIGQRREKRAANAIRDSGKKVGRNHA